MVCHAHSCLMKWLATSSLAPKLLCLRRPSAQLFRNVLRCRTVLFSAAIFSFIEMKLPVYDHGSVEEDGDRQRWILNKGLKSKIPTYVKTFRDFYHLADETDTCTADELHYVPVSGTRWQLALWRYCPPADAPLRKHPLLLLPAIGTKANCFDLDPRVSLARYMSEQGFDTWILEARGCGASKREGNYNVVDYTGKKENSIEMDHDGANGLRRPDSKSRHDIKSAGCFFKAFILFFETLDHLLDKVHSRLLPAKFVESASSNFMENSQTTQSFNHQIKGQLVNIFEGRPSLLLYFQTSFLSEKIANMFENAQLLFFLYFTNFQQRLSSTFGSFQKFIEPVEDYNWDFDTYLRDEIPTAIEYIRNQIHPEDGKLLSIGHSLGGIFLYGRLATHGNNSGLAGVVTVASALEYGVSNSSLKLLLPFKDVVGTLHGHVVPLDALMAIMYPLVVHPPYVFAWLGSHVAFGNNMDPDLYKKLLLTSFCPIPFKLLLQLSTVFQPGGLRNCEGSIVYKELLQDCDVPVLAIAADKDLICPPLAVLDTVKALPQEKAIFKQFGDDDHHYGHYDILCSDSAREEVFPVIVDFLVTCDRLPNQKHSPKLHGKSNLQDSEQKDFVWKRAESCDRGS